MNGESTIEEVVEAYHRNGYGTNPALIFKIFFNLLFRCNSGLTRKPLLGIAI